MSKIADAFNGKKALITYLMAGDPSLEDSRRLILAAQAAGADLIEIGIPFSDPIAEGEVIQAASLRALAAGARLDKVFEMVASLKGEVTVPLLFMTYLNPVFVYGYDLFFSHCQKIGICGIIIPDLPFEEEGEVKAVARNYGVEVVTLIAPTSAHRIQKIAQQAEGFLYLVSSMGVTGQRSSITTDIPAIVAEIRRYTSLPVAVGFGISSPEQAARLAAVSDGAIVGSAIVRLVGEQGGEAVPAVSALIRSLQEAVHAVAVPPPGEA